MLYLNFRHIMKRTKIIYLITAILCMHNIVQAQLNNTESLLATPTQIDKSKPSVKESHTILPYTMYKVSQHPLKYFAKPEVSLSNVQWELIEKPIYDTAVHFPNIADVYVMISMEKKKAIAHVHVPNYIQKADKTIWKLKYCDIQIKENENKSYKTTGSRVYASNSVLASGNFYKIAVAAPGVYKIDFDFIKNKLNIDPNTINTNYIRLYGNGGQMLSENNAVFRHDDLVENAIQVIDGNDGKWDNGDYILFYATGPHRIIPDSINKKYNHEFNLYAEQSAYFLNFDKGVGKRIGTLASLPSSNVAVNTFSDYTFYEKDSSNLGKLGKLWWGDEFSDMPGRYLNRNFALEIPDIDATKNVNIKSHLAAISYSGTNQFAVSVNGQQITNVNIDKTGPDYFYPVYIDKVVDENVTAAGNGIFNINIRFTKGSSSALGFLNYISINATRRLVMHNGMLLFNNLQVVGAGNIGAYTIQNVNPNTQVWDVSNPLQPEKINVNINGNELQFNADASSIKNYVAIDGSNYFIPNYLEKINNQNLHALGNVDYIIVVHPTLKSEAERLAYYHQQKRGYKTLIVTPQEIYNEFSSGMQDVSAIRDFIKMLYDRAPINQLPHSVLLFGDASYDYKDRVVGNTNLVPTSETENSKDKTLAYCSDDFFGFLDDHEDQNNFSLSQINTLDIGIGRLPVSSLSIAAGIVNKIMRYDSPLSFGSWKNNMTFNADNGDGNIHLEDAEAASGFVADSLPVFNKYKIYVGGYNIESTPAGPRAPAANKAVNEQIFNGTFLMNYNGHGGPGGWCDERIFSMDDINSMTNSNKLPLFITATCDFAPFDIPGLLSAGEILLSKPDGGAIALMTTTQLVYADQNRIMNLNYMKSGFKTDNTYKYPTLGDAYQLSKNLRYVSNINESAAANFRKFALLGDPGLPLAFPNHRVSTDSINGISVMQAYDTLKALGKYTISGHISDVNGNFLSDYNGVVYPTIFDKPKKLSTIDPGTSKREYAVQNNILYKGKATVKNGKFSFTFVVPKDINYEIAKGKISYYAENTQTDANGYDNKLYIGGSSSNPIIDNQGPIIKPYLNNEKFVNGGITTKNSILILKLTDDNGINYTGNSVGHDITAVLDGNVQNTYVLNNFFEADLDDYRSGTVRFPINNLSEGKHTLRFKAWDISNNSAEAQLDFIVTATDKGVLANVYNYPNPFSTKTQFMFEHNMPNQILNVSLRIMTISGKTVRNIRTQITAEGTRDSSIEWDGNDEYGDKLANGVYLYQLTVKSNNGFKDNKLQKLVILR